MLKLSNKKHSNKKINEKGSALILTMIVLVNALLIVSAITAISVQQKKQTSKIKNSAPAFQLADSGIEYVLKKKKEPTATINSICGSSHFNSTTGRAECSGSIISGQTIYFYFLEKDGNVIKNGAKLFSDTSPATGIYYIRAIGVFGEGSEGVTRSLQVQVLDT